MYKDEKKVTDEREQDMWDYCCVFADLFLRIFRCLKCLGFSDINVHPPASGIVSPGCSALPAPAAASVRAEALVLIVLSDLVVGCPSVTWHRLPNCCALTPLAFSPSGVQSASSSIVATYLLALESTPTAANPGSGYCHLLQSVQGLLVTSLQLSDMSFLVLTLQIEGGFCSAGLILTLLPRKCFLLLQNKVHIPSCSSESSVMISCAPLSAPASRTPCSSHLVPCSCFCSSSLPFFLLNVLNAASVWSTHFVSAVKCFLIWFYSRCNKELLVFCKYKCGYLQTSVL